ncbi:Plasmodium exported protein (PHIST), unknown, putative [Plasmodium sp.]|nr:Plasmodium exported protein (PHIST), unknown, putative [Plasmodium sp.]
MANKKNCIISPLHSAYRNNKGKINYISFKFLCLSLYIIGFYYVLLNTSLVNKGFEIVKFSNVYERTLGETEKNNKSSKRKRNLKRKKEDVNKTKQNVNDLKCNEQKLEKNKHSTNNDSKNTKVENKSNSSMNNINYNDTSKPLTETELLDVLNSLKKCPPKEDLRNIWTHTIGVAKEGFDNIQEELKASIQKYLDNDIDEGIDGYHGKCFLYDNIWKETVSGFCKAVAKKEIEYTKNYFTLVNDEHTLDDIVKYIYSFLEYFKTLKKELHEKYQKELLIKIEKAIVN